MRGRLWMLNMLLSNMVNVFLIFYVLENIEFLGAIGALGIMIASSCITLAISYVLIGKARTAEEDGESSLASWKVYLIVISIGVALIGFALNNSIVILVGFLLMAPVILLGLLRVLKIKI